MVDIGNKVLSTLEPAYIRQLNHSQSNSDKTSHLSIPFSVNDKIGVAFIDSGCTFNAISTGFAKQSNQKVEETYETINITIGGGQILQVNRRTTEISFDLGNLGPFNTKVFVLDHIPLNCDAIFGMEFLEHFNPSICWKSKAINMEPPAESHAIVEEDDYVAKMHHYFHYDYNSPSGITRIINEDQFCDQELKSIKPDSTDTFCFIINPVDQTEIGQRWFQIQLIPS